MGRWPRLEASECCCCSSCLPGLVLWGHLSHPFKASPEKPHPPPPLQTWRRNCRTTLPFPSDSASCQGPLSQKCPLKMATYTCLALTPQISSRWGFSLPMSLSALLQSAHSDRESSAFVGPLFWTTLVASAYFIGA